MQRRGQNWRRRLWINWAVDGILIMQLDEITWENGFREGQASRGGSASKQESNKEKP